MSLLGRINRKGSVVSVYRPIYGSGTGGRRPITGWTEVTVGIRMLLEELSGEMSKMVFGESMDQVVRGSTAALHAIAFEDRVLVTAGFLVGEGFWVQKRLRFNRIPHQELALVATEEEFP